MFIWMIPCCVFKVRECGSTSFTVTAIDRDMAEVVVKTDNRIMEIIFFKEFHWTA